MKIRRFLALSATALLLPLAAASAQPGLRVGATVTDSAGGQVGTITAISGANLTLRTDRHEVQLPVASFTATDNSVLFGMTQADLNAAVERVQAQAQQAFAVGTVVRDRDGAVVGPVQSLDAATVTIQLGTKVVRVPRAALAAGAEGLVVGGATLAQLEAAAVPAPTPEPAPAG
jgi:preprotein translocase subunit YajC